MMQASSGPCGSARSCPTCKAGTTLRYTFTAAAPLPAATVAVVATSSPPALRHVLCFVSGKVRGTSALHAA